MNKTATVAGVLTGALALGGASAAALAATPADFQVSAPAQNIVATASAEAHAPFVRVSNVQGLFGASQNIVTPVDKIASVFAKAAAVMCAALPDYDVTAVQGKIAVTGDVDNPFAATISEMAEEEGSVSFTLKCACASNIPGGGAIANAQVEGVSLASIAIAAGA